MTKRRRTPPRRAAARPALRRAGIELLEERLPLAAQMVADINPGAGGSDISSITPLAGSTILFSANDGTHGSELWRSDGAESGAWLVRDINPDAPGSSPTGLTKVGTVIYFAAADADFGAELWQTDGTTDGTSRVADIVTGSGSSSPADLFDFGGVLLFSADDGESGRELWRSDGTPLGTYRIADINPGPGGSNPGGWENVGGVVYFRADDGVHGSELWRTDGTPEGTWLVSDIQVGPDDSNIQELTAFAGQLFFSADDGVKGQELWKSDGVQTVLVNDFVIGGSGAPRSLTVIEDRLLFVTDTNQGQRVWSSDSTGTMQQVGIARAVYNFFDAPVLEGLSSNFTDLIEAGGQIFGTSTNILATWQGGNSGSPLIQSYGIGVAGPMISAGGRLIFLSSTSATGTELVEFLPDRPPANEQRVNTSTPGTQNDVRIASDAAGNTIIAWKDDFLGGLYFQRFAADGTRLGGQVRVSSIGSSDSHALAMNEHGDFVVTWTKGGTGLDVVARRYNADGTPLGSLIAVNNVTAGDQSTVSVAMDATGNFVVAWRTLSGSSATPIVARGFDTAGNPISSQFNVGVSSTRTTAFVDAENIFYINELRFLPDGNPQPGRTIYSEQIVLSTTDYAIDGDGDQIMVNGIVPIIRRRSREGRILGEPILISTIGIPFERAIIAADSVGNFVVVMLVPGSDPRVNALRYDANGTFQGRTVGDERLSPPAHSNMASAVLADDGTVTVTWGDRSNIELESFREVLAKRIVDDRPARVAQLANELGDEIVSGSPFPSTITNLRVTFSRTIDRTSATDLANYRLFKNNVDITSSITGISFVNGQPRLHFDKPLRSGNYELVVHDSVTDSLGRPLDGNVDGTAGGDHSFLFAVGPVLRIGGQVIVPTHPDTNTFPRITSVAVAPDGTMAIGWNSTFIGTRPLTDWLVEYDTSNGQVGAAPQELRSQILDMAVDSAGNYLVVTGVNPDFFVQKFSNQLPISESVTLTEAGGSSVNVPGMRAASVATNHHGDFIVAWTDLATDGQGRGIRAQRFSADMQQLGEPFTVNTTTAGNQDQPYVAMDSSGNFIVTWAASSDGTFAQRYFADGTKNGQEFPVGGYGTVTPRVALEDNGRFVFAWLKNDGRVRTYAQRFSADGIAIGPVLELAPSTTNSASLGDLFVDALGRALVVWRNYSDPGGMVYGQLISPTGDLLGGAFTLGSADTNFTFGMNESGDGVIAWSREGGTSGSGNSPLIFQRLSFDHAPIVDLNGFSSGTGFETYAIAGGAAVPVVDAGMFVSAIPSEYLISATVTIAGALPGDLLAVDTTDTSIVAAYANGVLSLTGNDSPLNYQKVLRTITRLAAGPRAVGDVIDVSFAVADDYYTSNIAHASVTIYKPGSASVADRRLFYNNSSFDGFDAQPVDDGALDASKVAYRGEGVAATFANVSGFVHGINGLFLDLAGDHLELTAADFRFRTGNSLNQDDWQDAPAPVFISSRPGDGTGGSTRVTLVWPDGAIKNTWLQVTVLATPRTGLAGDDVFYFGSRAGDTGVGNAGGFRVNASDLSAIRTASSSGGAVENPFDVNKDGLVNASDMSVARDHAEAGDLIVLLLGEIPHAPQAEPVVGAPATPLADTSDTPPVQMNHVTTWPVAEDDALAPPPPRPTQAGIAFALSSFATHAVTIEPPPALLIYQSPAAPPATSDAAPRSHLFAQLATVEGLLDLFDADSEDADASDDGSEL